MGWKKEKKEHPWASTATAKRIAKDHKKAKRKTIVSEVYNHKGERFTRTIVNEYSPKYPLGMKRISEKVTPLKAASSDFSGLFNASKRIAYQKKP